MSVEKEEDCPKEPHCPDVSVEGGAAETSRSSATAESDCPKEPHCLEVSVEGGAAADKPAVEKCKPKKAAKVVKGEIDEHHLSLLNAEVSRKRCSERIPKRELKRRIREATPRGSWVRENGLCKVEPYYHSYRSNAKGRWVGRNLIDVFQDEFREKDRAYYEWAIQKGRIVVNGAMVDIDYVVRMGDELNHLVHRHEPPISSAPIRIVDANSYPGLVAINKPAGIPVHPTGRYFYNTMMEILNDEMKPGALEHPGDTSLDSSRGALYLVNRLDRLTSGIVLVARSSQSCNEITTQFMERTVSKSYLCRCVGEFPEEEIVCEEPILTFSFKPSISCVSNKGKPCKTRFKRLSYNGRTSLVACFPETGRTHQIRVHIQHLGHPIANDPIYYCKHSVFSSSVSPINPDNDVSREEIVEELKRREPNETEYPLTDFTACLGCTFERRDPSPDELELFLHAYRYEGPGWCFEIPESQRPAWTKTDFDDAYLKPRFWDHDGLWDGRTAEFTRKDQS
ncbi:MAG: hypothetical protein SGCHY_001248 [Lobulomycetales sp.]